VSGCCAEEEEFDGVSRRYRRVLKLVILLNAGMFAAELVLGAQARSTALWADALDFAADAATYGMSLAVIGLAATVRAKAAMIKGGSLAFMGVLVLGTALWRAFDPALPHAFTMSATAVAAFGVNMASVLLLVGWREGDANVRSVWLCSRNDMVGNGLVLLAAGGVFGTASAWPDLLVAALMAVLFLSSSAQIIARARRELVRARANPNAPVHPRPIPRPPRKVPQ
jgi:Co/Zn/Cd efflux system component